MTPVPKTGGSRGRSKEWVEHGKECCTTCGKESGTLGGKETRLCFQLSAPLLEWSPRFVVPMYACAHACTRTHARTHAHTHTHTHTHKHFRREGHMCERARVRVRARAFGRKNLCP